MTEQMTKTERPLISSLGYHACQDDDWLWATLNIADMVGPITHELHNVLNNIVLQAAIVEREVPEAFRDDVAAVRRHAFRASSMLSQLDAYRHDVPVPKRPVDVAQLVREVVQEARRQGMNIDCRIEDSLPAVPGNEGDVWRLTWLLIQAAHAAGPPVTVGVSLQNQKLVLRVEDSGPAVEADQLDDVLEPFGSARAGPKTLERAAWLTIARRLKAKLRASAAPCGGVAISVEFSR